MAEKTYEVCPHCGEEVELDAELKVQTCPKCGKRIVTCSMCLACETKDNYCTHCCLEFQAQVENGEVESPLP
jgi:DNA-directed RNA polymerase subunit RPC12/RpoP